MQNTQRYILMPASNTQASNADNPEVKNFLIGLVPSLGLHTAAASVKLSVRNAPKTKAAAVNIKIIDSINEDGAKLVVIKDEEMADFRFSYPGLRIIPEKFYKRPPFPGDGILIKTKKAQVAVISEISVTDSDGKPIANADVVAFTNYNAKAGAAGKTNESGKVKLRLDNSKVERLFVYPKHSYWGFYKTSFTIATAMDIVLQRIDITFKDGLRHFYPTAKWPLITLPIRIAVIDSGVGPHPDLLVSGGANTIDGEPEADFGDNGDGDGHGTHVAGIIAANGTIKGMAAGVELYSYRVFPKVGEASNFYIMKAIKKAVEHGCIFINMSLGSEGLDEGIVSYVKDAYSKGVICFGANGNDNREPVNFPAAYSLCVAVGAMGTKGTFPAKTIQTSTVKAPFGKAPDNFVADFSNIGPETDLIAPGVGIISTYPGNDTFYAVMDGTSMACPAATGMAARLLAGRPDLLALPPTQYRADEILKFLSVHVKSMGFGTTFEGKGMLMP